MNALKTWSAGLRRDMANLPGWSTKEKIVVFESDDWGSIRMASREAHRQLLAQGLRVDRCRYNKYDALESNSDMEMLLEVLSAYRDETGRPPVLTALAIVANPDFDRIAASGFQSYFSEPFTRTLERYPEHERVMDLVRQGMDAKMFFPEFHGREHLNVPRWMKALQEENRSTRLAFEQGITGISQKVAADLNKSYQAAFDLDDPAEMEDQKNILKEGLELFEQLFGYRARLFVPPNYHFNNDLNGFLYQQGIDLMNTGKIAAEPQGGGKYKKSFRYIGKSTGHDRQIYLTRNCLFEPNDPTHDHWVAPCLQDIESAFRWNKPAVVSTHRINFMGFLQPENREKGLRQLDELLKKILQRWPDVRFLSSRELGDRILQGKARA